MSRVYEYTETLWDGRGEGFLFDEPACAMSFFRYPNTNGLRGIGLHEHPECDDIEILLEGRIRTFHSWNESREIEAPSVIANIAGTPHSVIPCPERGALVFGLRAPFLGGRPLARGERPRRGPGAAYALNSYAPGEHLLFTSDHTVAYVHKNVDRVRARRRVGSRVLVNLSPGPLRLETGDDLAPKATLHEKEGGGLAVSPAENLLVELIVKKESS